MFLNKGLCITCFIIFKLSLCNNRVFVLIIVILNFACLEPTMGCYHQGTFNFLCLFPQSMMELHKRRKALTEPEVRYFMKQIVEGCKYLHDNKIIHRDLKLGNLFLNDEMDVKIGDFGLATKVEVDGERKK